MKLTKLNENRGDPMKNGDMDGWIMDESKNTETIAYFDANPKAINQLTDYGQLPLTHSIYAENKELFDYFLSKKARNKADKHGILPMHMACMYDRDPYYMNELVKYGVDINKGNKKSGTPFQFMMDNILNSERGTGGSPRQEDMIKRGKQHVVTLKNMIKHGVDLNQSIKDRFDGTVPIIMSLVAESVNDLAFIMIKSDSSLIKASGGGFRNILHKALYRGNEEMSDYLFANHPELVDGVDRDDFIRYTTDSGSPERAVKLYNMLSDEEKAGIKLHWMLTTHGGEERLLAILDKGENVFIMPEFLTDERVQKMADDIAKTSSIDKIRELAVDSEIDISDVTAFLPQEVQDIFVF